MQHVTWFIDANLHYKNIIYSYIELKYMYKREEDLFNHIFSRKIFIYNYLVSETEIWQVYRYTYISSVIFNRMSCYFGPWRSIIFIRKKRGL